MHIFSDPILMTIGKVVLVIIMLSTCVFCLCVTFILIRWNTQLKLLESTAEIARENLMFSFTVLRARLSKFRERLDIPTFEFNPNNFLKIANFIMRFAFKNERNLFQMGKLGVKAAKFAYSFFKGR